MRHPLAGCLLYTSDAADERSSVDLGGRRIIKKKNIEEQRGSRNNKQTKEHRRIDSVTIMTKNDQGLDRDQK